MTDPDTTNDDAGSIRVTLDAPLTGTGRDAFTARHGLAPSPDPASPDTWHAEYLRVSSDPGGRTWTFTATRDTGRAQAETAALARDLWHQHGGAITATPAMRHRLTGPPPSAFRPLDAFCAAPAQVDFAVLDEAHQPLPRPAQLRGPGRAFTHDPLQPDPGPGWLTLTPADVLAGPGADPDPDQQRLAAVLARHQDPGGAIPDAQAGALAGELLTLLRAARLREGQHARIIPVHGDDSAPPGGRPAIITTITRDRLHAAANFGDHGWHLITFRLTDLLSEPPDPDADPITRLAEWTIQPHPAPAGQP